MTQQQLGRGKLPILTPSQRGRSAECLIWSLDGEVQFNSKNEAFSLEQTSDAQVTDQALGRLRIKIFRYNACAAPSRFTVIFQVRHEFLAALTLFIIR